VVRIMWRITEGGNVGQEHVCGNPGVLEHWYSDTQEAHLRVASLWLNRVSA
jgi:hypothetical protein